jgi:hypothetical protein
MLELEHGIVGKVTVACDGLSALRQVAKPYDFIDPNLPQFDLILATRNVIRKSSWAWTWSHVKGHQDTTKSVDNLDLLSQLNVRMDAKAKEFWSATKGKTSTTNLILEPWPTLIAGKKTHI